MPFFLSLKFLIEATDLELLQEQEGGVSCVRVITKYLRQGDFSSAKYVRQLEGDKTRVYPAIEKKLTEIFGCRSHGNKDCQQGFCRKE